MDNPTTNPLLRARSFGWWSLLCWLTLGIALEAMHGFKIGWYLAVTNEGRHLQLTLAHSHGTLLALINIGFAATFAANDATTLLLRAAWCLRWAAILMPAGFLLGGLWAMGADPGLGILLVPVGGLLLFVGVLSAARSTGGVATAGSPTNQSQSPPTKKKQ